jgi:hypothetical protein
MSKDGRIGRVTSNRRDVLNTIDDRKPLPFASRYLRLDGKIRPISPKN